MDYGTLSTDEIRRGYRCDADTESYRCNYCGTTFVEGEVYEVDGHLLLAERAIQHHIESEHDGVLSPLLSGGAKYNTFTDTQKQLLELFAQGLSDTEVANELGIKASTVRHQKFTFREKAKQAKYYLAVYDQVFGDVPSRRNPDELVKIPNTATMMDDRYVMTEKERQKILAAEFESLEPLRLKQFPIKAKKQVAVLTRIAEEFEFGRTYSNVEMKEKLSQISDDHNALSRYLVDYGFMDRTKDGTQYWMK